MRADRLVATTLLLQRRGRVTAAELAAYLEVSLATARRDLEALSAAGIPVYPQPGRGGGWRLVGGARTDLTGLTEPEVRALFLALATPADGGAVADTAFAKLVQALPEPFREQAELAGSAFRRDARGWEEPQRPEHPWIAPLQEAILRRLRCTIAYAARGRDRPRQIVVEPWRLVERGGVPYLLAGSDRGPRTYRVDRIAALERGGPAAVERPDDRRLDDLWSASAAMVEAARTAVSARVRAAPAVLDLLERALGSAVRRSEVEGEAVVAAHSERGLAEQLAGWGSRVLVLDPPAVIEQLRAIAAELDALYGRGSGSAEVLTLSR